MTGRPRRTPAEGLRAAGPVGAPDGQPPTAWSIRLPSRDLCAALLGFLAVAVTLLMMDPDARKTRMDRLLQALDAFDRAEAALQRDVIGLRLGLVSGRDPVPSDVARLLAAAEQLTTEANATAPQHRQAAETIARNARRHAVLALQWKQYNAQVWESLSHFGRIQAHEAERIPEVRAAAQAVLRFTQDRGVGGRAELKQRLDALERPPASIDPQRRADLVLHGRRLLALMPRNDVVAAKVLGYETATLRRELRARLSVERDEAEAAARRWRTMLVWITAVLALLLVGLTARLKAHVRRVRRMARLEHLVAEISAALTRTGLEDAAPAAREALGRLAASIGATRAFVHGSGAEDLDQTWSASEAGVPEDWPWRLHEIVSRDLAVKGALLLPGARPGPPALVAEMDARGAGALAIAWAGTEDGGLLLLGFEAPGALTILPAELDVLRLALDAIGGSLRRARLERARAELERRLDVAGRMEAIGVFASGIAHNFNNILAAVAGYAELAGGQARTGSSLARHLTEIRTAVCRARVLVDRILAFGRRRLAPPQPVAVAELLEETISLLQAGHEGAKIARDFRTRTAQVLGDPVELQQVLLNLGANALQASPPQAEIRISSRSIRLHGPRVVGRATLAPGRYVLVAVEDAGAGIPASVLPRIFEPFFTTREDGHGLGLATVAQIVQDHRGAIEVRSVLERGSCFRVYLPAGPRSAPVRTPPSADPVAGPPRGPKRNRRAHASPVA